MFNLNARLEVLAHAKAVLAQLPVAPIERTELHLGAGGVELALRHMNSYFPELQAKGKQGIKEFALVAARPAGCEEIVRRGGLDVLISRLLPDPEFQPYAALALAHIAAGPIIHDVTGAVALAGAGAPMAPAALLPQFAPLLTDANPRFRQSAMLALVNIILSPAGAGFLGGLAELALGMAQPDWDTEIVAQHGIAPILALVQQLTGLLQHPRFVGYAALSLSCLIEHPRYAVHSVVPPEVLVRLLLNLLTLDMPPLAERASHYDICARAVHALADITRPEARIGVILPLPELLRIMTAAFLLPRIRSLPPQFRHPRDISERLMQVFANLAQRNSEIHDDPDIDINFIRVILEFSANQYRCQGASLSILANLSRFKSVCTQIVKMPYTWGWACYSPTHFFSAIPFFKGL